MREDRGAVAIMVSMMLVPVLMGSAAIGIDMANWYYTGQRLQVAADAAALAGSVYMPSDFTTATSHARAVSTQNGFTHDPSNADPLKQVTVAPATGEKASELRVTVTAKVRNFFGWAIGDGTQTMTRTAVAEYRGPVLMGSPCNLFGNEPSGSVTDQSSSTPVTTRANYASAASDPSCTTTPQLWANIGGKGADKVWGDRYSASGCAGGETNCSGYTNTEYSPLGHFYKLSVKEAVSSVSIQIYDPVMVDVTSSSQCDSTSLPNPWTTNNPNPFTQQTGDAAARYTRGATAYCPGDQTYGGSASTAVTTFAVRDPESSGSPLNASVHSGCTQQYKGWQPSGTSYLTSRLNSSNGSYDMDLARGFRQWSQLCTITNPTVGDYYIQIRTNLPNGTSSAAALNSTTNDTLSWDGQNRFAMRAVVNGTASNVSLAGYGSMSIYANNPSTDAQFYLSRVNAASAGMSMDIALFDAGDVSSPGSITVIPPPDATTGGAAMALSTCQGLGVVVGSDASPSTQANCQLTNVSTSTDEQAGSPAGYQGRMQTLRVAIPADYSCDEASQFGCWFKIRMQFPGGANDATTWATDLVGQPVRLVE
jgi:Flp pilus assembly protein TadG